MIYGRWLSSKRWWYVRFYFRESPASVHWTAFPNKVRAIYELLICTKKIRKWYTSMERFVVPFPEVIVSLCRPLHCPTLLSRGPPADKYTIQTRNISLVVCSESNCQPQNCTMISRTRKVFMDSCKLAQSQWWQRRFQSSQGYLFALSFSYRLIHKISEKTHLRTKSPLLLDSVSWFLRSQWHVLQVTKQSVAPSSFHKSSIFCSWCLFHLNHLLTLKIDCFDT